MSDPQRPPRPSKQPPRDAPKEPPPPRRPPQAPTPPRPSKRPQQGAAQGAPRPPQPNPPRPQHQGGPRQPQGGGPRPRPQGGPPRPSKRPPAQGQPPLGPRPSRRPENVGPPRPQRPSPVGDVPRAPRLPTDLKPKGPPRADAPRPPSAPPPAAPEELRPRRVALPLLADAAPLDEFGEPDFPEGEWPEHGVLLQVAYVRKGDGARSVPCDAGPMTLRHGESVFVEGERGLDLATVTAPPRREFVRARPALRVTRRASKNDLEAETRTRLREADGRRVATDLARAQSLAAKVVRVECSPSGNRTTVYLASEERVELRDFGRAITAALKGRVDIRHVGVRDAAKAVGGVGPCGLQLCCNTFLTEFAPVSIRHAKDQGLALNPQRVSGVCGRLMCCLVYEDAFYRQQRALFPKQGRRVATPRGEGRVRDVDVLARTVRVVFPDGQSEAFTVEDVRAVAAPQGGREEPDDAKE